MGSRVPGVNAVDHTKTRQCRPIFRIAYDRQNIDKSQPKQSLASKQRLPMTYSSSSNQLSKSACRARFGHDTFAAAALAVENSFPAFVL
jgi:hypothetical protein